MKKKMFFIAILVSMTVASSVAQNGSVIRLPRNIRDKFVFIPNANIDINGQMHATPAFYMSTYEISNEQYKVFLDEMKASGQYTDELMIDTAGWQNIVEYAYNMPYVQFYHSHEAYKNYPVVNISHKAAQEYCKWLTKKVNADSNDPAWQYEFVLPGRDLWLAAAQAGDSLAVYSWGNTPIINENGYAMCNFREIGDEYIHCDPGTRALSVITPKETEFSITSPINSYEANIYGVFNLNGNVAEMIAEEGIAVGGSWNCTGYDVRNTSMMQYKKSSPYVGFRPILIVTAK